MARRTDFRTRAQNAFGQETPGRYDGGRAQTNLESEVRGPARGEEGARIFELVDRNPFAAVMAAFGLGLGFGLGLTVLLTRREENWFERNMPESMQNLPDRLKHVPETLGSYVPRWAQR